MKLQILDFTEKNGLVFCATPKKAKNNAEILYINEAQKLGVDAVLFRRYYKEGEDTPYRSEPAVCVLDKNTNFFNGDEHIKLHAAIWSAGKNEAYIIKSTSRTDIINARRPAEQGDDGKLNIENILLATSTAINGINEELFSSYLFCNGTFWEQTEFEKEINEESSPYIYLLNHLMTVRKKLLNPNTLGLLPETIDKLLVTFILIKFLEEIKDDQGKHTLKAIYTKYKIQNIAEGVAKGDCVGILNDLANEFNGKIFDKFTPEEKNKIDKANLTILANFLQANIDLTTNQGFIWEQYSFKHLPAEVISAIYENFIQAEAIREKGEKEKGVVYTPIHLVNLMIDEVMPLDKPELFNNNSFKILDPACGSGVFLVAAFKRLLQWWAINNSSRDNIQYPDCKVAQKILEDNIFGVDVKKTATLVSVFGLTTALLDKLTPQEIWNNLKFKDLSQKNIQHSSFFDWAVIAKENNSFFNLIIGNPPFNIETGKQKKEVLNADVLAKIDLKHKNIPLKNFALHFFEVAMLFSEKVCMIIPASVFLYSRSSQNYRNQLFTDYTVRKIFDFTHLRRDLFHKTADTPVVALIAEGIPSSQEPIEHIIVKRTISTEKKIRFEIDYYDYHKVKWDWAVDANKSFVWKTNLLGGGQLFQLIYKLSMLDTLAEYVAQKKENDASWIYSSGYKIGGNTEKNPEPALFVAQGNKIEKISENGNYTIAVKGEETNKFEFYPNERIYEPPLVVFDQVLGKNNIPVSFIKKYSPKKYIYFSRDFVGIHASEKNLKELQRIYSFVKDKYCNLYRLYALVSSGSAMVSTETEINKRDIDVLPFPENEEYLSLSGAETAIQDDVLNYYIHLGKAINHTSDGFVLHKKVEQTQLKEYGKTFCEALNEIYSKNGKFWQAGTVHTTDFYTIYQLGFGKKGKLSYKFEPIANEAIKSLIEDNLSNSGTIYTRIIRIYKHLNGYDCLFFIKPNAHRYWLNSIALRDADDTFVALQKAGF